jgi:16S rRNA (guanine527-N7)-methyltransferase
LTQVSPTSPAERLARYLALVESFGRRINLVGSTEPAALAVHVADSLAAAAALPAGARVADLGSGAGFPGVPIAIQRPDLAITLVEIRERRVDFLRQVARALDLRCEIHRGRLEDPAARPFDFALLRAVAPPARALALGRTWVGGTGEIWIWASPRVREAPAEVAGEIPLPRGGRILRTPALAMPRGTH